MKCGADWVEISQFPLHQRLYINRAAEPLLSQSVQKLSQSFAGIGAHIFITITFGHLQLEHLLSETDINKIHIYSQ